jgi:uncharacterized hydrophobic protein (TIGR00271 family)
VLQLRLVIPTSCTEAVLALLGGDETVVSVSLHRGAAVKPAGADVGVCDVLRDHASELITQLERIGVSTTGEISVLPIEATRSEPAHEARRRAPGHGSDVVVWQVLEDQVHQDAVPSVAFFCFMAVAALIATVGIVVDSSVLIVGAMVVGPEYGPLAASALALYRKRWAVARGALGVLLAGLGLAIVTSAFFTGVFDLGDTGIVAPGSRFFTRFVTEPNAYSAIVAFAAGLVGVMAVGLGRSGALTGVVVSATTIPAAAAIGVNAADGAWSEAGAGAIQLGINVTCLCLGSLSALWAYRLVWREIDDHPRSGAT